MISSLFKFLIKVVVISFIAYAGVNNKEIMDPTKALCIGLISSIVLSILSNTPIYSESFQESVSNKVSDKKEAEDKVKQAKEKANKAIAVAKAAKKAVVVAKVEKKKVDAGQTVAKTIVAKTPKTTVAKAPKTIVQKTAVVPMPKPKIAVPIPTPKLPTKANKGKFPIRTKQELSKLSMQEQKVVDTVQVQDLKTAIKGKKKRANKNYGYSFLPVSEWNLPIPDRRQCIPQRECPVCPQSSVGTGSYLEVEGANLLPPQQKTEEV